ncbi:hypothetical protein NIGALANA_243 [Bacillus phage Nigalana]|uniref:hypothetical protein n=1 Tax=Bacillus phage Nigalana TaxID=1805951 RepID=UPI0007A7718D|nr:hypothetical protein BI005_gp243 [Bacillus phage Nigalana]AMW61453.1 hypothetical protein NIGALANA_243 [Bacillus phage Nigalana]
MPVSNILRVNCHTVFQDEMELSKEIADYDVEVMKVKITEREYEGMDEEDATYAMVHLDKETAKLVAEKLMEFALEEN